MAKGRYTPLNANSVESGVAGVTSVQPGGVAAVAGGVAVDAASSTYSGSVSAGGGIGVGTGVGSVGIGGNGGNGGARRTPGGFRPPAHVQRGHNNNNPFICSGLFAACFARVSRFFPSRTMAVGYTSGLLVNTNSSAPPPSTSVDSSHLPAISPLPHRPAPQFAVGWWLFIDGVVYATTRNNDDLPAVRFEDWLPGILSTLSLIIVNLIDKDSLNADDFSYSGTNVACKARACAFVGITMAMGALGGSFAILALKYLMPGLSGEDIYFGVMVSLQNVLIFIGSMTLWFGRNSNQDGYDQAYSF
ncbi:hypothetical protein BC830DRAFT_1079145 [Chytriomyces sp. MP71]|nr:hypothetical protein BC830DRAFT_1079145 [Chytriomyces sp. MP71]